MKVLSLLKGIAGSVIAKLAKEAAPQPALITPENNPELIKAVMAKMDEGNAQTMAQKIADLEKATYHLSGRIQQLLEQHKQHEEILVNISTTLEEMLNGIENSLQATAIEQEEQEEEQEEDESLEDAWDTKKDASTLN